MVSSASRRLIMYLSVGFENPIAAKSPLAKCDAAGCRSKPAAGARFLNQLLAFAFLEVAKFVLTTLHLASGNAAITHRHESAVNIPMDIEFTESQNLRCNE
jgi:hypothetical protein